MAWGSESTILVSDASRGSLIVLAREGLEPIGELAVGGHPLAIGFWESPVDRLDHRSSRIGERPPPRPFEKLGPSRIFVGDDSTGRVVAWSPQGDRLFEFESTAAPLVRATDIAVAPACRLVFVCDPGSGRVRIFDIDGHFVRDLTGEGDARLRRPTSVGVDEFLNRVIVSDSGDPLAGIGARLQVFDLDGRSLSAIAGDTQPTGFRFSRPQGLAVDGDGGVWVVDSLLGQVLLFDIDSGVPLAVVGEYGSAPGQLLLPIGALFDPVRRRLVVASNRSGRVVDYTIAGGGR